MHRFRRDQPTWDYRRLAGFADRPSPDSRSVAAGRVARVLIGGESLLASAWAYEAFADVEGVSGGYAKLLAMIGAFLGWPSSCSGMMAKDGIG